MYTIFAFVTLVATAIINLIQGWWWTVPQKYNKGAARQKVLHPYFFYDIVGYRLNVHLQGKSRAGSSNSIQIIEKNKLLFIKLLLYKIDPKFDRFHIFKEWGFSRCGAEVYYLSRNDIDLLQEVIEVIDELEREYKNTAKELLNCVVE